jgi:hypothetical protein
LTITIDVGSDDVQNGFGTALMSMLESVIRIQAIFYCNKSVEIEKEDDDI